jgi:hypothetical protein
MTASGTSELKKNLPPSDVTERRGNQKNQNERTPPRPIFKNSVSRRKKKISSLSLFC